VTDREDDESTVESSLEELIQKKAAERPLEEEEDDVLDLDQGREEQPGADTLIVKALPQQANEFTCSRCFLVKHRSQLADKRKGVCRDCA
jgi:hypothetical protein